MHEAELKKHTKLTATTDCRNIKQHVRTEYFGTKYTLRLTTQTQVY